MSVRVPLTPELRQGYLDDMTGSEVSVPGAGRLEDLHCSFCLKDKGAVAKIVAGPGVYICDQCINLCNDMLAEDTTGDLANWDALATRHCAAQFGSLGTITGAAWRVVE